MTAKYTIREILAMTRESCWDQIHVRQSVRINFDRVLKCGTPALGAEVYTSHTEKKVLFHRCRSRACVSCGHRATILWQREQWCVLPDIPYTGIVVTMPQEFRLILRENRRLLNDIASVAALSVQSLVKEMFGAEIYLMAVQQSFGSDLKFHPHVHMLMSSGGLHKADLRWIPSLSIDKGVIMKRWRASLIHYLRLAFDAGSIQTELSKEAFHLLLDKQSGRWWNIHLDPIHSKKHFLHYAARYIRHPPLAQSRLLEVNPEQIAFRYKDYKARCKSIMRVTPTEFVSMLMDHVPDKYANAIRYFGLLSPRLKRYADLAFEMLGQVKKPRPKRLSWPQSSRKYFHIDPLLDSKGKLMKWSGRLPPAIAFQST